MKGVFKSIFLLKFFAFFLMFILTAAGCSLQTEKIRIIEIEKEVMPDINPVYELETEQESEQEKENDSEAEKTPHLSFFAYNILIMPKSSVYLS